MAVVSIAAWTVQEPVDAVVNAKIRDEGLNRSQVAPIFTMLVDTIGPRLTASPEHKRAAEFMRDTATKYGLSNARLEPFEFGRGWELDKLTIEMVEPRYMPLLGYAEAWSPSTSGELVVRAVSVAGKSADDIRAMPASLKGAAVLQLAIVTNFITTDRPDPTSEPDVPQPPAGHAAENRAGWRTLQSDQPAAPATAAGEAPGERPVTVS